ncbi:FAD-dependent monooxygenase [Actinocorallia sp. API 0066]|uniref:FAD-dependent monooxygenase n=1 Tax=Actinocorallia sp. API 0066 TaxID=2896846 RepID=UPI001E4C2BC7|nr:FAD-dependent monooxygenase [Actinocorallia sp. API 0066]MCD0451735.1 FAD-dependent monooxygenase [Actinocorallia sp. API 0066]
MSHPVVSTSVVIVGAGPAGLTLAAELGLLGVPAVVLERSAEPRTDAPGVAINVSAAELLDQRGLLDPLRADATAFPIAHYSLLTLDLGHLSAEHETSFQVPQSAVERVLAARAVELGADLRYGHEVTGLVQDDDGVTLTVSTADGERTLRARYAVGADGADGVVRTLAGIGFDLVDEPFAGLIGEFTVDYAEVAVQHLGVHYSPAGGHFMGIPLGPDLLRVVTAEFTRSPADPAAEPDLDELIERADALTSQALRTKETLWLRRYTNPTGVAESYRAGRVLLAGDAAHSHFPLNGQAITTGIEDAFNLGWKLAAVLAGHGTDDLLDTYDAERRPIGRQVVDSVRAQVALSGPEEEIGPLRELFGRLIGLEPVNRRLLYEVTNVAVYYPVPGVPHHRLLGFRLPPVPLTTSAGPVTLAETLHEGRGVLLDFSGGAAGLTALAGWAGRVGVVTAEPVAKIDAPVVLLRPDGHVAWAGPAEAAAEGLPPILGTWFGEPVGQEPVPAL